MREILFRGQTRRFGERVWMNGEKVPSNWVYGGIFQGTGDFSVIYGADKENFTGADLGKHTVYTDTVGQYTGMRDCRGNRIFEGDIVVYDNSPYNAYCEPIAGEIAWRKGSLCFKYKVWKSASYRSLCSDDFFAAKCEVIGNIHDNPELLSEEADDGQAKN